VGDLANLRAESRLIRPTGYRLEHCWPPGPSERIQQSLVTITWNGQSISRSFDVCSSAQRLGGRRWWWRCRSCGRRCGILLSPWCYSEPDWACRRCWRAKYKSQYPPSLRLRFLMEWLGPDNPVDLERQFAYLVAPRRRGVRRGRHLFLRTARTLVKIMRQQERIAVMWSAYVAQRQPAPQRTHTRR
jgi:hypothetical protein